MEQNKIERDKRYLVFSYYAYYPNGGLDDLIDSFDSAQVARDFAKGLGHSYTEVYDRIEGALIYTIGSREDIDIRLPNEA